MTIAEVKSAMVDTIGLSFLRHLYQPLGDTVAINK